ncbi:glycoside hydrolase family 79 protein [Xylariaceae sp. FL1651]|nr:glycoside hydrolase family 79 protein [Xylariaceae sp. FL1651]
MFPKTLTLAGLLLSLGKPRLAVFLPRASISVQVPATVPADASPEIDPDFPALAFEQASFVRYAQDDGGNINAFSTNLMDAIYSRTGGKPNIRLGGTSSDYGKYLPGQTEPALPVAEQNNYQNIGHTTIGPSYWQLTKNFPSAVYMIQVPLATTNISEPIAWVQSAVAVMGIDKIFSIQPGNEADLYTNTFTGADGIALHPPQYQGKLSNASYVGNWTKYVAAIKEAVPSLPSGRFFTAFDTSTHFGANVMAEQYVFAVDTCFDLGIDAGGVVKEVSHHYYQGQAGTAATLGSTLMNLTTTHTHLDQYKVRIDWLRANKPDVPFVLSEVGNSLQPTNTYAYQARLGSALWQVDFYLYSMAIGVRRINYQQIMHSGFDMWLPVASAGLPAQVFANFYSQPFVADFMGGPSSSSGSSSSRTCVSRLSLDDDVAADGNVAAYVAYDDGAPRRIAVVNMNYWNQTSSAGARGSVVLDFEVPADVTQVTVYHLNSPMGAGATADTITYGGSQWTYASLGKEVKNVRRDTETVAVVDGVASVTVASSEAVLVWL